MPTGPTVQEVKAFLDKQAGSLMDKYDAWQATYNSLPDPPTSGWLDENALAQWIVDNYSGPWPPK